MTEANEEGNQKMEHSPSNASLPTTVRTKTKRKSLGFGKSSDLNETVGQMSRLEVNSMGLHQSPSGHISIDTKSFV
jgi:hypothetical protein